ncbi:MAG: peptidase M14, partial [Bacteroidota bacterium]
VLENRWLGIMKEQKRNPERLEVENIAGMSSVVVRWIVEGGSSYTVKVNSEKGGKAERRSR